MYSGSLAGNRFDHVTVLKDGVPYTGYWAIDYSAPGVIRINFSLTGALFIAH